MKDQLGLIILAGFFVKKSQNFYSNKNFIDCHFCIMLKQKYQINYKKINNKLTIIIKKEEKYQKYRKKYRQVK